MEEVIYNIYQHIVNYLILVYFKIEFPQDTLYWVLSSIVQSLLVLVALLGVVIIFKLQTIKNSEERILNDEVLRENIRYFGDVEPPSPVASPEELIATIDKIIETSSDPRSRSKIIRIKETKLKLEGFSREKTFLRKFFLKFGIYTFAVVIIVLVLLMFAHIIYQYNLSLPILFLTILLTAYSLFLAIKGISKALS